MVKLKIVTWNVNSIRVRLGHLAELVKLQDPDVVCIQEVKAKESDFPFEEVRALGFEHIALYGMAGYNGVAILSKLPFDKVENLDWCEKCDARQIRVNIKDVEINNIYIPAGGDIPDIKTNPSFAHKIQFIEEVADYFSKHKAEYENKKMVLCGDFNIAPLENDVWDHKQMSKTISHTPLEIEKIANLQNSLGFINALREKYTEPQKLYSWWGYRNYNWKTNDKGRLLDHIWVTKPLKSNIDKIELLKDFRYMERPSDHIPIVMTLEV